MTNSFGKRWLPIVIASLISGLALATPDIDVHPRNLEAPLPNNNARRDTLIVDNDEGDQDLIWRMSVIAEVEGWLSASPDTGTIRPGQAALIVVRQDGRDLDPGHYYGIVRIESNDPNKPVYDIPVAGHTTNYPRIEATWAIPGQGEWWGIDLDRVIGVMEWGRTYSFNLNIRNRGSSLLDCDTIVCNNGYFTFTPGNFDLAAGANRNVLVTFSAEEVGGNSGSVSSISNAWDPRELNFRLTGTVLPAFRRGGNLPDTVMAEDAQELLVADLDTIFIASDAGVEISVAADPGLLTRVARNKELYIRGRPHWYGTGQIVATAVQGDSVLSDTFIVRVTPTPDAPLPFDLYYPNDGDTLYYDGGDSLFAWQSTSDPDGDTVRYMLAVLPRGVLEPPVFGGTTTDTTFNLAAFYTDSTRNGWFEWNVAAIGGGDIIKSWSTFAFYLAPGRLSVKSTPLPIEFELIEVFPNPFNGQTNLSVQFTKPGNLTIRLFDSNGRQILARNEDFEGYKRVILFDLVNLSGGNYWFEIEFDGNRYRKPVSLIR